MVSVIGVAAVGFCISLYMYLVEQKVKQDPSYKPFCDLSDRVSCTKPMKSDYGNLLFVSNTLIGMIYYALVAGLASVHASSLLLAATVGGCLVSCYLAYLLLVKIKSVCLLCVSLYVVNGLLAYLAFTSI